MKKAAFTFNLYMVGLFILAFAMQMSSFGQTPVLQGKPVPVNFCISQTVMDLYSRINDYRLQNNLPPVQLSKSLCYVATLHAKDLMLHHPDQGGCNSHSWSDKSFWKPFCYPRDENKKNSVWDKPRELTAYPAKAYEIVYWENSPLVADTVIMVWKTEEYFNSFLLNTGKWREKPWNAIGIAIYENYACAWFGESTDPEGTAYVCGNMPVVQKKDTIKPGAVVKKPRITAVKKVKTDSLSTRPADTIPPKAVAPVSKTDTVAKTYYIIVKTNLSMDAATKLVGALKVQEYPGAKVITRDDKIRVSVFESTSKPEVMTKLKEVKKTYKDAWLYKTEKTTAP
ncbi:MAG: CAP domain-containing protein [Bacteroidota bacterium]